MKVACVVRPDVKACAGYRSRMVHETNEDKRNALLHVCLEYLERYYVLIAFTSFMIEPDFNPQSLSQPSFGEWMTHRPELKRWTPYCHVHAC